MAMLQGMGKARRGLSLIYKILANEIKYAALDSKKVEQHPPIWDVNNKKYSDRHAKNEIWKQIILTLYPEWDTLTPKLKKQIGKDVRNRWRSVRDQFRKSLNDLGKSGSSPPKRKLPSSDLLQFLNIGRELRQTDGNIPTQESACEDSNPLPSSASEDEIDTSQDVSVSQAAPCSQGDGHPSTSSGGPRRKGRAHFQTKTHSGSVMPTVMEKEALNMITRVEKEDHWDRLVGSIAEQIRQLPESRQWLSIPPIFELLTLFGNPSPIPNNAEILFTMRNLFEKYSNANIGERDTYRSNTETSYIGPRSTRMGGTHMTQSLERATSSHIQDASTSQGSFMELLTSSPLPSPGITKVSLTSQLSQLYDTQKSHSA
ncbi:uncharacterized protein [Dendropsophus ebraccatus]|uniref:uncharacterized protein isoform X1 n=2 Tax=Dendropsophus ebraccatus TaxID=150705 RepID=UPI003831A00D